jgi:hypothetical protein
MDNQHFAEKLVGPVSRTLDHSCPDAQAARVTGLPTTTKIAAE